MDVEDMGNASTSTSTSSEKVTEIEIPWPVYSNVFNIREDLSNERNYAFACKLCFNGKIIHANKSSAANLKKHMKVFINLFIKIIL